MLMTLSSQVVPGTPCLARFSEDDTIYRFHKFEITRGLLVTQKKHRAVVLKRDGALAKVYYLDYGNSESLSLGSIFSMPPGQLATQMLSIRCRSVMITSIIVSFQFCCRYL